LIVYEGDRNNPRIVCRKSSKIAIIAVLSLRNQMGKGMSMPPPDSA